MAKIYISFQSQEINIFPPLVALKYHFNTDFDWLHSKVQNPRIYHSIWDIEGSMHKPTPTHKNVVGIFVTIKQWLNNNLMYKEKSYINL